MKIQKKINNLDSTQVEIKSIRLISQSEEDYKNLIPEFKIFLKNGTHIKINLDEDELIVVNSKKKNRKIEISELLKMY